MFGTEGSFYGEQGKGGRQKLGCYLLPELDKVSTYQRFSHFLLVLKGEWILVTLALSLKNPMYTSTTVLSTGKILNAFAWPRRQPPVVWKDPCRLREPPNL